MWLNHHPEGKRLDFDGDDLRGIGVFAGSNLRYSSFVDCFLPACDFRGSDLLAANFQHCDLVGARFQHCDLVGANFDLSDIRCAGFQNADLYNAIFSSTIMTGSNFESAICHGTNFMWSKMKYVVWKNAKFDNDTIFSCRLQLKVLSFKKTVD